MVKHLAGLDQPNKQAAEVAVHFKRLEAAEELYRKMDRLDLAVGLRSKLGEWRICLGGLG
jgi:WD repeat-containing protein 35